MHHSFVFRADAGPGIGAGHVMRCLALAQRLNDAGHYSSFACRQETVESLPALARSGMPILKLSCSEYDEPEQLHQFWNSRGIRPFLVVDHYDRGKDFEKLCKPWTQKILVFEDLPVRIHDCDLLLDASPTASIEDYDGLVPKKCQILTGPKYALIRQEFLAIKKRSLIFRHDMNDRLIRVFVSFGSVDGKRMLLPTLKVLREKQVGVDVAVGRAAPHLELIRQMTEAQLGEAKLHIDTDSVAELMASADIGIGAGGITALERCVVGLPSLICCAADNQRRNIDALSKIGAALAIDAKAGFEKILNSSLKYLQDNISERINMAYKAASICDGLGALRVLLACIGGMSTQYGQMITFRPAEYSDAKLIYTWQSSDNMRIYFRNPQIPAWNEHKKWLKEKLLQHQSILLIVLADCVPAGLLRLEPFDERYAQKEISILIAPEHQGKGIAGVSLSLAEAVFPGIGFFAEVLPDNLGSHQLFSKAGYNQKSETWFFRSPRL